MDSGQPYYCNSDLNRRRPAPTEGSIPHESVTRVAEEIVSCQRCARLRAYCQRVAREKKSAHRDEEDWGKPVPGFGDPRARVLILGLAPAAHGANRTGRVFTGDGIGASGDFLMAALHRAGLSNLATSRHPDDGLRYAIATSRPRCVARRLRTSHHLQRSPHARTSRC